MKVDRKRFTRVHQYWLKGNYAPSPELAGLSTIFTGEDQFVIRVIELNYQSSMTITPGLSELESLQKRWKVVIFYGRPELSDLKSNENVGLSAQKDQTDGEPIIISHSGSGWGGICRPIGWLHVKSR